MKPLALPDNPRVLVVALRRLGDVLLTTPLIRSVKRAWPAASIDALVFAGTEGILSGNPDIAEVITLEQRPRVGETLALIRRLGKRYDLATAGRRVSNATYFASHGTDQETALSFAMDLTPLVEDPSLSIADYVLGFIDNFRKDVESRLTALG